MRKLTLLSPLRGKPGHAAGFSSCRKEIRGCAASSVDVLAVCLGCLQQPHLAYFEKGKCKLGSDVLRVHAQ